MKSSIGIIVIAAGLAQGNTILLQSGVSAGETNNITVSNVALSDLEPEWTPGTDGASWISYEDTGWSTVSNGPVNAVANSTGPSDPSAIFFQTFTDTSSLLTLTITVWADDSAVVYLDGTKISLNADFVQTPGIFCSPTGITCDGPGTTFTIDDIAPGTHTLQFDVYQVGGGSFGLMYTGSVTDTAATPEPVSFVLMGAGLVALALFRVKRASDSLI